MEHQRRTMRDGGWVKLVVALLAVAWVCIGAAIAVSTKHPDDVVPNLLWYIGLSAVVCAIAVALAYSS